MQLQSPIISVGKLRQRFQVKGQSLLSKLIWTQPFFSTSCASNHFEILYMKIAKTPSTGTVIIHVEGSNRKAHFLLVILRGAYDKEFL